MLNSRFAGSAVTWSLALSLWAIDCSVEKTPESVLREYQDAWNFHNVSLALTFVSDDIEFSKGQILEISGREAFKGIAEFDSVLNSRLTINNFLAKGDSVYCTMTERNDLLNEAGIDSAYFPETVFVVKNGQISVIKAVPSDSLAKEYEDVFGEFLSWIEQNYPDRMARLMPGGRLVYNAENGRRIISSMREWRQASEIESAD